MLSRCNSSNIITLGLFCSTFHITNNSRFICLKRIIRINNNSRISYSSQNSSYYCLPNNFTTIPTFCQIPMISSSYSSYISISYNFYCNTNSIVFSFNFAFIVMTSEISVIAPSPIILFNFFICNTSLFLPHLEYKSILHHMG